VDAGGYTPEPRDLPDPALLKISLAKDDLLLQKALATPRAKTGGNSRLRRAKLHPVGAV
jgi:hypothetical protein